MTTEIRPTESQYADWVKDQFDLSLDAATQDRYRNTSTRLTLDFESSPYWKRVCRDLRNLDDARAASQYPLLTRSENPIVATKSWASLILKSYRKNVLNNSEWPGPPSHGWITPDNWLEQITDVVRTTVVVRYMDGVNDVLRLLEDSAIAEGIELYPEHAARAEGYYALHVRTMVPFEMLSADNSRLVTTPLPVEIQVCTQMQEVLRALTHELYEVRRRQPVPLDTQWQWDCESDEFVPNYLGHILHYADGMIMNIRTQRESKHHVES